MIHRIDNLIPDHEIGGVRMPAFYEGDLIENVHPTRRHVLLCNKHQKALIVEVKYNEAGWCYDILLDGALWPSVSARIVEATWRLSTDATVIDATEQCN